MIVSTRVLKRFRQRIRSTQIYQVKLWLERHSLTRAWKNQGMLKFYSQFISPGATCFDIGANIGNRTEIFLQLGAKVIAVDPQDSCLQHLHNKFGKNKHVVIVGKAVGANEGYAELAICESTTTVSTLSDKWQNDSRFAGEYDWKCKQSVAVTTLNKLIDTYGTPQFCKIDVEGFELEVFKGLTKPIHYISFEISYEMKQEIKQCISHLQSIGQVELNCSYAESMKWLLAKWMTPEAFCQYLDEIEDDKFWGDAYVKFLNVE
jgi:FkbM family methyltransferase